MKTIFPRSVRLIALSLLCVFVTACGNKGPLVPPKASTLASATASASLTLVRTARLPS